MLKEKLKMMNGVLENGNYQLGQFKFGELRKSEFVERFPELSPFFKACRAFYDEMICIFPYFCPYAESAREIRGIFVALHQ